MKVLFSRAAGFDRPVTAEVELAELETGFGPALDELRAMSRRRPDAVLVSQPRYAITVPGASGEGPPALVVMYESHVTRTLRPLIEELTRRAL